MQGKRIILLGAPGAGKGTQANLLANKLNIPKISTGDMLRVAVANDTDTGRQAKDLMNSGQLVPDEIILKLIKNRVTEADCSNGFLFDGFPRTVVQAEGLQDAGIEIDYVIAIEVPDSEVIKRLTGRRVHLSSGRTYHVEFNPPKTPGIDDITGEVLVQRADDRLETVKERLDVYHQQTEPLLSWYQGEKPEHGRDNLSPKKYLSHNCYKGNAKYIKVVGTGTLGSIQDQIMTEISGAQSVADRG